MCHTEQCFIQVPCSFIYLFTQSDFIHWDYLWCSAFQYTYILVSTYLKKARKYSPALILLLNHCHSPPDKLQNSIIQIVTHVWQRLTFSHVNPFCVGLRLQLNSSKPDLLTVIRAEGRAIVSLPARTLLRAWLKAVNTKLFKVNLQPPPLTEANQYTINVRLVRLSSK